MNSRERVIRALNHQEPDRIPLDLGGSVVTGMHVSSVHQLRQALRLDAPRTPVKVTEPFQMLGEIAPDLIDALGIDVVSLTSTRTCFGFHNAGWKPWTTFDGTPVLVPDGFNTEPAPDGDILLYPGGDKSAPPSGRMPRDSWYFHPVERAPADVRQQVRQRIRTLRPGGGFVFNTIHNVQPRVPVANILAMFETLRDHGRYPF